ncbi:PIR protein [Plasmodium ovale]|uniref:PIR protein n=1 Tax=Plasmodium ovale TaxID=36330 RepID=A0A1C3KFH5_PLAOA|nr:PIR protein [Plasmodium ovale]
MEGYGLYIIFFLFLLIQTLGKGDLPANDFDDEWKTATNFLKFSNPVNLESKIDNMENWIDDFDKQLVMIYDANSLGEFGDKRDKRCRDLNYYINYVLHYIPKITKDTENATDIKNRFINFVRVKFDAWEKFNTPPNFDCKRSFEEYTNKMYFIKSLDDYCENRDDFKKKLVEYNKITCCKYAKHINEMKRSFRDYISWGQMTKEDTDFHIGDNCTLKNFGKTFPNVTCNNNNMSEIESDELLIPYGSGYLYGSQQHMSPGIHTEDSLSSSPTKIALTSVSTLLGACLSGLYLYRHSFVGSMLRNFQNKNHISPEDTYDDVNGMFSEGPTQYINTPEGNDRFYIAYDSIRN